MAPRQCFYAVLGVPRDATELDIKVAYRKAALQWHPDKNGDNLEEATERFQEISEAYATLSDPAEKAWYDNHREQILRGGSGLDEEDDYIGIDLFKFFRRSCYKGYTDEEGGFYNVYSSVFEVIDELEAEDVEGYEPSAPAMGSRNTPWLDCPSQFFAYWENFSSQRAFWWCDEYNPNEASNRQEKRAIEKHNAKCREIGKKEFNEHVRRLATWVKKRDPRRVLHQRSLAQLNEQRASQQRQKEEELRRLRKEKAMSAEQEVEIEVDESAVEYFAEVEMMQALSSKGKRGKKLREEILAMQRAEAAQEAIAEQKALAAAGADACEGGGESEVGLMSVSELKEEIIALGGNAEGCFERGEVEEKLLQARVGGSVRWAREDRQGGEGESGNGGEEEDPDGAEDETSIDVQGMLDKAKKKRLAKMVKKKAADVPGGGDEDEEAGQEREGRRSGATQKENTKAKVREQGEKLGGLDADAEDTELQEEGAAPGVRLEHRLEKQTKREFELLDLKYKARVAIEALCTHDFLREGKKSITREKKPGSSSAWALIHLDDVEKQHYATLIGRAHDPQLKSIKMNGSWYTERTAMKTFFGDTAVIRGAKSVGVQSPAAAGGEAAAGEGLGLHGRHGTGGSRGRAEGAQGDGSEGDEMFESELARLEATHVPSMRAGAMPAAVEGEVEGEAADGIHEWGGKSVVDDACCNSEIGVDPGSWLVVKYSPSSKSMSVGAEISHVSSHTQLHAAAGAAVSAAAVAAAADTCPADGTTEEQRRRAKEGKLTKEELKAIRKAKAEAKSKRGTHFGPLAKIDDRAVLEALQEGVEYRIGVNISSKAKAAGKAEDGEGEEEGEGKMKMKKMTRQEAKLLRQQKAQRAGKDRPSGWG